MDDWISSRRWYLSALVVYLDFAKARAASDCMTCVDFLRIDEFISR
jgi:hypothetical protein